MGFGWMVTIFFIGGIIFGLCVGIAQCKQENAGITMTKEQEEGIMGLFIAIGLLLSPIAAIFDLAKKSK